MSSLDYWSSVIMGIKVCPWSTPGLGPERPAVDLEARILINVPDFADYFRTFHTEFAVHLLIGRE